MNNKNFQSQVVYQIYVRSFYDSNGDGIGDINGIIEKMPYISSLGIDYIWLNPIFPSPNYDNGYDIKDYCSIDPIFGTMNDMENLIAIANQYHIKIIFDMVFNHTSTEHPWFQKALSGDEYYKDFYFFRESNAPPTNWESKFGGSAWKALDQNPEEYYLHLFHEHQADLNWKNEAVRKNLHDILRFWIQKGIRGFRFDVINLISKPDEFINDPNGDGRKFYTDGPKVDTYLKELNRVIKDTCPNEEFLLVGELSSTTADKCISYSKQENDELSMIFHFQHLKTDYQSDVNKWELSEVNYSKLKSLFHEWQVQMAKHHAFDALFWNNHDQPRAVTRFASKEKEYHFQSATLLASTIHFMLGTPYIYMGEEIGMVNPEFDDINEYRDVETLNYHQILLEQGKTEDEVMQIMKERSRDNARTPMQWNSKKHAGFTDNIPWINVPSNKDFINVEAEEKKESGVLSFYKELIALRKKHEIIQIGNYHPFLEDIKNIIAYTRENELQYLLCLNNYNNASIVIEKQRFEPFWKMKNSVLATNYKVNQVDFHEDICLKPYETLVVFFSR